MQLVSGIRLGPYEIVSPLGAGGMGEVYRARDTKLQRDVALKMLPDAFALDTERVARFKREAQVLASLNHPNIGAIYGFEDGDGIHALVLELVDGPTLADRIAQGPMPLDEAIPIAKQIAEALEAAHEQGIIHRDLKPANIKVRDDGTVKVLDFGLAKAMEPASGVRAAAAGLTNSPTITSPALMTGVGVLLGTAAYMSPEQARGENADKRSDIWALGCVLYEMLSGKRAFDGDSIMEVLSAVLRTEPDWAALPGDVPAAILTVLQQCVRKDRRHRIVDISTVVFVLEHAPSLASPHSGIRSSALPSPQIAASHRWLHVLAVGGVALLIGTASAAMYFRSRTVPLTSDAPAMQFALVPPPGVTLAVSVNQIVPAVSPDGRQLVFIGSRPGEPSRLWVRRFDSLNARPLAGTDDARSPFWSPDSHKLAFFAEDKLKIIDIAAGSAESLCDVPNGASNPGASWGRAGTIVFARRGGGLMKVAATGGQPSQATVVDTSKGDVSHVFPAFLPDGRRFLFVSRPANELWLGSLDSTAVIRVSSAASQVQYSDGHLLFARGGTLVAQPFDPDHPVIAGEPRVIAERLAVDSIIGAAAFSISDTGVLAVRTGAASQPTQLTWVDRSGRDGGAVGAIGAYRNPRLSRDQTRVAVEMTDSENHTQDVYILDLARGTPTRFTSDPGNDVYPVWSNDDREIVFGSDRDQGTYNLYLKSSTPGSREELLLQSTGDNLTGPYDWSADGRFLLFRDLSAETLRAANVGILPLAGDRKPHLLFPPANFNQVYPQISPDGRWVAYTSAERGRAEVYVASFPSGRGGVSVSTDGGSRPRWRGDSRELYYYATDGRMMAVSVSGTATPAVDTPTALFPARLLGGSVTQTGYRAQYDVTRDGQKFLLNVPVDQETALPTITVVLNWVGQRQL
jgi:serine/threonine protein kinase/Tol biopolymer transport system component